MSLITQCPACATMFRVVPDQLRISEGWVRCGQCDEVFDANAHLQTWSPSGVPPLNSQVPPEPQNAVHQESPLADVQTVPEVAAYDWSGIDTGQPLPRPGHAEAMEPSPQPEPSVEIPGEATVAALEHDAQPSVVLDGDHFLSHNPHELPVAEASMAEQYAAAPVEQEQILPEANHAAQAPLSFMPRKEQEHPWRHPVLIVSVVLAAVVLVFQIALFERNRLAAIFPGVAPVLETACAAVGCSIAAPRQIDAFAIESSTFNAVKPGVYVLQVTLKNSAALDLESPALELSLSDRQEQVVLRRTIQAAEYAEGAVVIAAGSERSFRVPLAIGESVSSRSIAGYKLLAYYP